MFIIQSQQRFLNYYLKQLIFVIFRYYLLFQKHQRSIQKANSFLTEKNSKEEFLENNDNNYEKNNSHSKKNSINFSVNFTKRMSKFNNKQTSIDDLEIGENRNSQFNEEDVIHYKPKSMDRIFDEEDDFDEINNNLHSNSVERF